MIVLKYSRFCKTGLGVHRKIWQRNIRFNSCRLDLSHSHVKWCSTSTLSASVDHLRFRLFKCWSKFVPRMHYHHHSFIHPFNQTALYLHIHPLIDVLFDCRHQRPLRLKTENAGIVFIRRKWSHMSDSCWNKLIPFFDISDMY